MKIAGTIEARAGMALSYSVNFDEQESELHGLNGGKITKLLIERENEPVFEYNRGHIVKAVAAEGIAEALAVLIYKYN